MEILKASEGSIERVVDLLGKGKVLILPTDTVYGLISDARNTKAVGKIFAIKKRKRNKPIAIFVRSLEATKRLAEFGPDEESFLSSVWPGKTTVVLKSSGYLAGRFFGRNIGIRIPDYPFLLTVLDRLKFPLAETSANISGEGAGSDFTEIRTLLDSKVAPEAGVDGGKLPASSPSTVVDISSGKIIILREGAVSIETLETLYRESQRL